MLGLLVSSGGPQTCSSRTCADFLSPADFSKTLWCQSLTNMLANIWLSAQQLRLHCNVSWEHGKKIGTLKKRLLVKDYPASVGLSASVVITQRTKLWKRDSVFSLNESQLAELSFTQREKWMKKMKKIFTRVVTLCKGNYYVFNEFNNSVFLHFNSIKYLCFVFQMSSSWKWLCY